MTRTVLALALALGIASPITPAYGGDDVVQLDLVHPRDAAGFVYSLELEGPDHLVGPLYVGKVDLRKEDGVWSGWVGFDLYLQAGRAEPLGNGEIKVTLQSARWRALHQFVIRPTADGGVELSGRGVWDGAQHAHSFLSADATTLTSGHCGDVRSRRSLSSCLRFTGETGRSYEGQYDGLQDDGNARRYRLQADGHLTPAATARENPVLYVLLYVIIPSSEFCPQCGWGPQRGPGGVMPSRPRTPRRSPGDRPPCPDPPCGGLQSASPVPQTAPIIRQHDQQNHNEPHADSPCSAFHDSPFVGLSDPMHVAGYFRFDLVASRRAPA